MPDELTLQHAIRAGELVPSAALGAGDQQDSVEVSLAVEPEHVPLGVDAGSRVDVWVVGEGRGQTRRARPVLHDTEVVAAPHVAESFATATARQIVLRVPTREEEGLAMLLAASGEGLVRVVGRS